MSSHPMNSQSIKALDMLARPVTGVAEDYDTLLELIGERRFVLIGEASHGTHERCV